MHRWINKQNVVYTQRNIITEYSAIKIREFWHMLQHRWILSTFCSANIKSLTKVLCGTAASAPILRPTKLQGPFTDTGPSQEPRLNSLQSHKCGEVPDRASLWASLRHLQGILFVHPLEKTLWCLPKPCSFLVWIDESVPSQGTQKHSTHGP